ncbi:P-loop NTPase fold protein [Rhodopseudomonas sp.]|uniref:P-loop NTPase fold protein n=1 Tax=Rhodopseudomonas sp. TaxID=1078 RepID=UPI003B3A19D5
MSDVNKHVWDYLDYYLRLPHSPQFAVVISGVWGVGKTYLVKEFLKERFGEDAKKYVYVSLYGLSSVEEIDDALFQAAFPLATGSAAKVVGRVAKAGLKFLKVDPGDWNIKEFLNKFQAEVYVFDDLERCDTPKNAVLGYINQFVEHGGAKVLIIANEKEIGVEEDYNRRREKLIGKTLEVQSVFKEAFDYFSSKIDCPDASSFIKENSSEISSIYGQSGLNNLRILQQTMWDFERFYSVLQPQHRSNKDAMITLLRLLFALSFEIKAARLSEEDILKGRGLAAMMLAHLRKDGEKSPIERADDRYVAVDLNDNVLSNELLVNFLVRGVVNANSIHAELKASRFFVTSADEASWRTVWHWMERSDEEFDVALKKMSEQFEARAFTQAGEILHVFGLMLFLADQGVLTDTRLEIVEEGKKYIDDLYKAKKLEIVDAYHETQFEGWGGLGIYECKTTEYRELFLHLVEALQSAGRDRYPQIAQDLLSKMQSEVQEFYRGVVVGGGSQYVGVPVLATLDVSRFVDVFLSLHPSDQHVVMMALKGRYEHGQLERDLRDEKPWIIALREALLERGSKLEPIGTLRIQRQTEWYLKSADPAA